MLTKKQYIIRPRRRKVRSSVTPALFQNPQKKGYVSKVILRSPKKPNSAKRKVAKVGLGAMFNKQRVKLKRVHVETYIPGEGHNLQQYNAILMMGGKIPDLPGVRYRCIRGALDLKAVEGRKKARSRYGTKNLGRLNKLFGSSA